MSTKKKPVTAPASSRSIIGAAGLIVALAGMIVLANVFTSDNDATTSKGNVNVADGMFLAPDEREIRVASGTIVRMADRAFEMDTMLDGRERRLSVQLAQGAKVYRATIATDVSPLADENSVTREEISVADLRVGDAVSVQSERDLRGTDTVSVSVVEHAVLTSRSQ